MNALFISDSHGCKNYLNYALYLAKVYNVKAIIHCGDIGKSALQYFANETKDYDVFIVPGNHDFMHKLRKIERDNEHVHLLDDKLIEYEGLQIIGKRLPMNCRQWNGYKRTLEDLLDEAFSKSDKVILASHYFLKDKTPYANKLLQVNGHKHPNRWWMYIWGKCRNFVKLSSRNVVNKYEGVYNVALKILLMPLSNDYKDVKYI